MSPKSISYVLVTGATGFIGAHCLDELLRRGLKVRVAVRNFKKAELLKDARPDFKDKIDFVQVADFSEATSFEEAIKDVDGIIHVASPLSFNLKDNEKEMILPAINGVKSVLEAATKNPTIQRIVITSSFASVIDINRKRPPHYTYTAADWNPLTYEEAVRHGTDAVVAYRASKKFAERAAWDFIEKQNPSFDIVTLCPPMVFGPFAHPVARLEELNDSLSNLWDIVNGEALPTARVPFWVDVRDLARAHVEALLRPEVGNKRFTIAASERFSYEKAANIIIGTFDWAKSRVNQSITPQEIDESQDLDGQTAAKELGLSYRPFRESVVDFVNQAVRLEEELKTTHGSKNE